MQHTFDVSYSEDWNIVRPYVKVLRKEGRRGREGTGRERREEDRREGEGMEEEEERRT